MRKRIMPFPECKVYSDGSHFIAIPHTTRPKRKAKSLENISGGIRKDKSHITVNAQLYY